jgi:hypothetical protein
MPGIIKIDPSEMPIIAHGLQHPEFTAVRELKAGEAMKFPCRWNHRTPEKGCRAMTAIITIFKQRLWKGHWLCRDKWVYVHRVV